MTPADRLLCSCAECRATKTASASTSPVAGRRSRAGVRPPTQPVRPAHPIQLIRKFQLAFRILNQKRGSHRQVLGLVSQFFRPAVHAASLPQRLWRQ